MAQLTNDQRSALTRLGAHARLAELVAEMDAILAAFPDLGALPARAKKSEAPAKARPARKKYRMSPEKRKAQAERMRAYWAARRAAKETTAAQQGAAGRKARGRKRR